MPDTLSNSSPEPTFTRLDQPQLLAAETAASSAFQREANRGPSYLGLAVDSVTSPFVSDADTQSQVRMYGSNFVKAAALFLRGRLGLAGTIGSYALDQMRPGDSATEQITDLALGSTKGVAMRGVFGKLGSMQLDFATKGMVLGTSSRMVDVGLNRHTFTDGQGNFSFTDGLANVRKQAFDPVALTADVVTFGIAHGAFRGANSLSGRALERSPMLSTMLTGTTFGASTGGYHEIARQRAAGEELDIGKIAKHALIQGGLDTIAAVPGGMQARAATRIVDLTQTRQIESDLGLRTASATTAESISLRRATAAYETTRSLPETMKQVLDRTSGPKPFGDFEPTTRFVENLYRQAQPHERVRLIEQLRDTVMQPIHPGQDGKAALAFDTAAQIAKVDPTTVRTLFFEPVQRALENGHHGFNWQQFVASEAAILEYAGRMEPGVIRSPELKMRTNHKLDVVTQERFRTDAEAALRDSNALNNAMGSGVLGRLFPQIFGFHGEGGIVGRPQNSGHQFTLDQHTVKVLENVRRNPEFVKLSQKEQTDVLWAALLHDVGKRPLEIHPGHEKISAGMGWGVLETLGYSTQRIQRITNLVSEHQQLSYLPDPQHLRMMEDPTVVDYFANKYKHGPALKQLRILNEADIRSLDSAATYWSPEVQRELDRRHHIVQQRAHELSRSESLPILTTELQPGFRVIENPGNYVFMAHANRGIASGEFFRNLHAVERGDAPVAVVRPGHAKLPEGTDVVALMTAPPERINTKIGAVNPLAKELTKYDSLTELQHSGNTRLRDVHDTLLQTPFGQIAVNNPAVTGIGVFRRGQQQIVIPNTVLENAQRLNIPVVILD